MRRSFKFEETHYATLLTLSLSKLAEIPKPDGLPELLNQNKPFPLKF